MRSLFTRLDSPLLPLIFIVAAGALFVGGMLRRNNFNPSWFVTAGDRFCDPTLVPKNLVVRKNSDGFDGQFYYRLALDPRTSKKTDFGITLDAPPLRHQRILYPLLAGALSLGNVSFLPSIMLLINFSALCVLGWIGGIYAQSLKQHALWGVFLPLYPGSLLTLTRDLVELLEISLLLGSILLVRRNRHLSATLLLTFAVLAKETALLVAIASVLIYIVDYLRNQKGRVRWYYPATPIAAFVIWQLILYQNWGEFPVMTGKINIGPPLIGFLNFLIDTSAYQTPLQRRAFPELIFLICFTISVFYCLRSTLASAPEIFSFLLYATLALFLSEAIWVEDWTFLRAIGEFTVIGTLILIGSRSRVRIPILACSLMFWLFLFSRLLRHGD